MIARAYVVIMTDSSIKEPTLDSHMFLPPSNNPYLIAWESTSTHLSTMQAARSLAIVLIAQAVLEVSYLPMFNM